MLILVWLISLSLILYYGFFVLIVIPVVTELEKLNLKEFSDENFCNKVFVSLYILYLYFLDLVLYLGLS